MAEKAVQSLVGIASGSIGKALAYADNNALGKYDDLSKIVYAKNKFSIADLLAFCDAAVSDEDSYYLIQELVLKFIAKTIRAKAIIPTNWREPWDNAIKVFNETERLNLVKKQALINIITNVIKVI